MTGMGRFADIGRCRLETQLFVFAGFEGDIPDRPTKAPFADPVRLT